MDNKIRKLKKLYHRAWEETCKNIDKLPSIIGKRRRIIALGDIHGDFKLLKKSLKLGKVLDNNNNWIGGDTVVVQVGDQIDRCRVDFINVMDCSNPNSTIDDEDSDFKILEFMTKLHYKAKKHGGAVYSLLGNHEMMNVMGDFRYVSWKNLASLGKNKEEALKNRAHVFKPGNKVANFLACTRQTMIIIGSNIFMHAGLVEDIAKIHGINDINMIVSLYLLNKLNNKEEFNNILFDGRISPLWTRLLGYIPTLKNKNHLEEAGRKLGETLKHYNVRSIVVGHTPQIENGIQSMCGNKLHIVDLGLSKAFDTVQGIKQGRQVQLLEIMHDTQYNVIKEKLE